MGGFIVTGGKSLFGECRVHGAKNSILPLLAAAYLCDGESVFLNCPRLSDVSACIEILESLGCVVAFSGDSVSVKAENAEGYEISQKLMKRMRSSIVFLGAIASKTGRALAAYPGGCEIGQRPIDIHLKALSRMGLIIDDKHGIINAKAENGLSGCRILLDFQSVGATENIILAAVKAKGETVIYNAAMEPEIADLCGFLNICGAKINGAGTSTIVIEGVEKLYGSVYTVMPDRIEAGTFLCAAAITGGRLLLRDVEPESINPAVQTLSKMGCDIFPYEKEVYIKAPKRLSNFDLIRTMPHPGFPSDMQALFAAVSAVSEGTGVIIENIFENRFGYVPELIKMGADIKTEGRMAVIKGVPSLFAAEVAACDLRAGAALLIAALAASGESRIDGAEHIDRGYEAPEETLRSLGADIKRIPPKLQKKGNIKWKTETEEGFIPPEEHLRDM